MLMLILGKAYHRLRESELDTSTIAAALTLTVC